MEIITAKSAGFCFGVERAVNTVYEKIEMNNGPIYTFGPIIHNETVVADFDKKGVRVIEDENEAAGLLEGTLIIRSHGITKRQFELFSSNPYINIVDCTCPFVKRIHNTVQKESLAGKNIIIIGDRKHPEVIGIKGWCETESYVIGDIEEALNFNENHDKEFCIVSQTTLSSTIFEEIVEVLKEKRYNTTVVYTICNATCERQTEAAKIAGMVDAMIVIGGKTSSNSKKLYDICKKKCDRTVFIQTANDLSDDFKGITGRVGITAGASTPKNIIEEVQNYVRNDL